jgi:chromosome segregation ATPase
MANKEKVKSIIKDLMEQLYEAKGFDNLDCNALERNMFEAEMKYLWEEVEAHTILYTDEREEYEDEIEDLKDQLGDVKDEYDALMVKYEDLEEDYKDLEKTLDKVKEAIWS